MKHFGAFGNFWVYSDTVSAVFLVPSERHSLVVVLRSFRVSGLHLITRVNRATTQQGATELDHSATTTEAFLPTDTAAFDSPTCSTPINISRRIAQCRKRQFTRALCGESVLMSKDNYAQFGFDDLCVCAATLAMFLISILSFVCRAP